jgi:hypothetical protein
LEFQSNIGEFREDINPDYRATIILAAIDGLAIHWFSAPRAFSLNRMKESLVTIILNGMKKGYVG